MPPPTKRRKTSRVAEITFNDGAREEYLTGFHKRKVARQKAAQEAAEKRAKEEKVQDRKELRETRKRELEEHVAAVNAAVKQANVEMGFDVASEDEDKDEDSGEDAKGEAPAEVVVREAIDHEEEYIDEDKYTTVTVEGVNITKHGIEKNVESDDEFEGFGEDKAAEEDAEAKAKSAKTESRDVQANGKRVWTKERPSRDAPKKKKKKFRYESKEDRKATRMKERSRNKAQAQARKSK